MENEIKEKRVANFYVKKVFDLANQLDVLFFKSSDNEEIDNKLVISLYKDLYFYYSLYKYYMVSTKWNCYFDERICQLLEYAKQECRKIIFCDICNDLISNQDCSSEDTSNLLGE